MAAPSPCKGSTGRARPEPGMWLRAAGGAHWGANGQASLHALLSTGQAVTSSVRPVGASPDWHVPICRAVRLPAASVGWSAPATGSAGPCSPFCGSPAQNTVHTSRNEKPSEQSQPRVQFQEGKKEKETVMEDLGASKGQRILAAVEAPSQPPERVTWVTLWNAHDGSWRSHDTLCPRWCFWKMPSYEYRGRAAEPSLCYLSPAGSFSLPPQSNCGRQACVITEPRVSVLLSTHGRLETWPLPLPGASLACGWSPALTGREERPAAEAAVGTGFWEGHTTGCGPPARRWGHRAAGGSGGWSQTGPCGGERQREQTPVCPAPLPSVRPLSARVIQQVCLPHWTRTGPSGQ